MSKPSSPTRSTCCARPARASAADSEYGCGPTMHRAIAASKYAFRIDMADWLADNLAEAREWLCADE